MKVLILYRPNSEEDTLVNDFKRDFERQTDKEVELADRDTPEGMQMATTYGIMDFPAVLAIGSDGSLRNAWQGKTLPTMSEVLYYKMQ